MGRADHKIQEQCLNVREWCEANHLCTQTYYRWQRRLFEIAQAQQTVQFAEVIPVAAIRSGSIAATVWIFGNQADIYNGTDAATVDTVLRILSC